MAFANRHHAFVTAICFAIGISGAYYFLDLLQPVLIQLLFLTALALLFACYFLLKPWFYGMALVVFVLAGLNLGFNHFAFFPENHLLFKPWQKVTAFAGWISSSTYQKNGKNRYILELEYIEIDSLRMPATAKILLWQKVGHQRFNYGQRLKIAGALSLPELPTNPGEFNYRKYLNFQDVFFQSTIQPQQVQMLTGVSGSWLKRRLLVPLQNRIRTIIRTNIPEPTADLVQALILGERQNLNREIYRQFQKTGIVHLLAISGLHVGFVLLLFLTLAGLFPVTWRMKYGLAFLFLALFVALVNFKAPVVRASLMAVLYFGLKELQRQPTPLNILGLAAFIILVFDPDQLFQPGFQFSFAAVGGILLGYPNLKKMINWNPQTGLAKKVNRWLVQAAWISLAAVLATVPLTWWYYGTIQIGAIFINLLIIPVMGIIVILSLILVLMGLIKVPVLLGLGSIIHIIFTLVQRLVHFCAQWPFIQLKIGHPGLLSVVLATVIVFYLYQINRQRAKVKVLLFLLMLLIFLSVKRNDELKVVFVNVGQGDAALIQLPDGNNVLIDGGENRPWFNAGNRYLMPLLDYFGIKRIKYAVATHPHTDHFGGLISALNEVSIDTLVISRYPDRTTSYLKFLKLAKEKKIPVKKVTCGQKLLLGTKVRAYILHPFGRFVRSFKKNGAEINNSSIVIKLCYGNTTFLFTGDAQQKTENALNRYQNFLQSTVLKVGHHGSITSSSLPFLKLVSPKFAVVSVGKKNKFGHPSKKVLERFKTLRVPLLRTDRLGAIIFTSNGQQIHLVNWRKGNLVF